jgi:FkbH-like protein
MKESAGQHFFARALTLARACRTQGDLAGAWRELRVGLDAPMDNSQLVSAARFLENTARTNAPAGWPTRRVGLIGADTLTFLTPVVRALAFRDGWWPEFYEAPFGAWRQEILEPNSALRKFQPEVTLVLRGWRSVGEASLAPEQLLADELALARCASTGLGIVIWPSYDLPVKNTQLSVALKKVNEQLMASLPLGMLWADLTEAQAGLQASWEDERLWESVRQHPSSAGGIAMVEAWLALLRARWGKMRKVLVTDLDNVLWGGVVGEDGMDGVRVGAGTSDGPAHLAYQEYLLELKNKGVLLAVCSKNNEADVLEVFTKRNFPLCREDFTGWMVNWLDKAENIRLLAAKLKLGLDSFVFVDDQPAERSRVRQALPEVAVPELPESSAQYVACLRERRFFDRLSLTDEDRGRAAAYQANEQRDQLLSGAASLDDFLRSLEMVAEYGEFNDATLDRVEQLLARTNQWNLTTQRPNQAEILALMSQPGTLTQWFRLRDKFGDHGLVGLWIVRPCEAAEFEIDSWVMSCRVIGRGLEDLMFNILVEKASAVGVKSLRGIYRPTAKNSLVAGLLPGLGFSSTNAGLGNDEKHFTLALSSVTLRKHFIQMHFADHGEH